MNNTIKDLPCYYASTPIGKKEGSPDCSKFATRTFFDRNRSNLSIMWRTLSKNIRVI